MVKEDVEQIVVKGFNNGGLCWLKAIVHAITSLVISAIMYFAHLPIESCVFCFLTGVFLDVDHFVDYLLWSEDKDLKKFWILGPNYYIEIHSTDSLFHSIDLFSPLVIPFYLYWPKAGTGVIVGFLSHLALDQMGFRYSPLHFFLLYRMFVEKKKALALRNAVLKRDDLSAETAGQQTTYNSTETLNRVIGTHGIPLKIGWLPARNVTCVDMVPGCFTSGKITDNAINRKGGSMIQNIVLPWRSP